MKRLLSFFCTVLLAWGLLMIPAHATGVYDLPPLSSGDPTWVIDNADTISRANEAKVSGDLKKLADRTGNEVRMVVIRRLDFGQTMNQFADDLFNKWYPTPEEKENQTLLIIDTLTNATAIRTGKGVQNLLTDDIADSVVSETVAVPLKNGAKYNQALLDASRRVSAVLSGEPDPGPPDVQEINIDSTFTSAEDTNDTSASIWVIVFLFFATLIPMVTYFWYAGFPWGGGGEEEE
ncbi:beta-propeller domain-containing protein, methanol dehydrogenase [Aphanothece hegewaldii CCALA 016]|uniref:Beta-propeller domain-containing protein, methanol dehydrogenase n=1 Tax=Aphanothece hegewaldii CCALA 016 TaxID=2107694 RepID=A0A2T1M061_9CHRO|nr:TPM domain-containing protein [Aphanothece hegewaldii]PSF38037.1 beta-propeller domain-containing protein, methanol dehydrogenase [Aphanothece hegewaldii CCALA 016]